MTNQGPVVRLDFCSAFDMVDFVEVVSDQMGRLAGLDEDAIHWVSVAVRESVINAIKHGNHSDEQKRVYVEFSPRPADAPTELLVRVRDEGPGFDPDTLPDPLAPENMMKSSGRGIFLIKSFMDEMVLQRAPEGGMEMRMLKRAQPSGA